MIVTIKAITLNLVSMLLGSIFGVARTTLEVGKCSLGHLLLGAFSALERCLSGG
jgi:hypothetical protein